MAIFGNNNRQRERDFYEKTKRNATAGRRDLEQGVNKKNKTKASSTLFYKLPTTLIGVGSGIFMPLFIQFAGMTLHNLNHNIEPKSFFDNVGAMPLILIWIIFVTPILTWYIGRQIKAVWSNNNAMYLTEDIEEYQNDGYVQTADHIIRDYEAAPDAGLGFDGHVSTIVSHMMVDNKGIKKVDMPQFDANEPGQVAKDNKGNIITKKMPMFDKDFGNMLYDFSRVPLDSRSWVNATDYSYDSKDTEDKISIQEILENVKKGRLRQRSPKSLADYINQNFYPLPTDTQRPAGVYFYDDRPVHTLLIAITRGGKGQTYIEPAVDLWTREKKQWNLFSTDPKGELLAKFYYPATIRGMDIVQFNLMHPHLTDIFNPLINAVQQFRRNNPTKGTAIIDTIISTLFPDNGEIWNPAAGNMFRRAVYMVFDYFIEQEKYLRYVGHRDNVAQEIIDQEIDTLYSKVTLFNVYRLIGDLAAKVSKDENFINVNPEDPMVTEKDLLTLMFDAMAMLPTNDLRSKAITANNAIKQVASAQQTIAGIYATLLTGLSVYADDTAIALMSGGLSDSFDITGLGFPRRFGVRFDDLFIKKFRIMNELCLWTFYRDSHFEDMYEGDEFKHKEKIPPSGWTWGMFEGMFEEDISYVRLEIVSGSTIIKQFNFRFTKGYKTFDNISYIIDPITKKKIVSGGTLEEWDIKEQNVKVSTFSANTFDYVGQTYRIKDMPILTANQVYYTERPKFVFAITPPHLQVYQKHILVIIKQILDEQYDNSYKTKETRKPIVGTRLMLEEFGNIRSGENGIPDIDTATSIALGQNVQITFVLQSFQQLRAIYDESIEKVIRSNSSNTIFLKSNDEELINDLVRASGTMHEFRVKSKSVSRKLGDVITTAEPVVNFSGEHSETTTLTANDFLFLAGKSPGNSITLISGEMPIVNKLSTITPMAAGLHQKLPQEQYDERKGQTKPYSDATMPTAKSIDNINYLDNVIDGEALVRARVAQAKIAKEMEKTILDVAERNGVSIGVENGELSELMMNFVYEEYEKEAGTVRTNLSTPIEYYQVAEDLSQGILTIRDPDASRETKMSVATNMRESLVRCIMDKNLDHLTASYRDQKVDNILGYSPIAIATFVGQMLVEYPKPQPLDVEEIDIDAMAEENENYRKQDPFAEEVFDVYDNNHISALEHILIQIVDKVITIPQGVDIREEEDEYRMYIHNQFIISYRITDGEYLFVLNDDFTLINEEVSSVPELVSLLQSVIIENE